MSGTADVQQMWIVSPKKWGKGNCMIFSSNELYSLLDNESKILYGSLDRLWSQADLSSNPNFTHSSCVIWGKSCNNRFPPNIPSIRSLVTKWGKPDNVILKWGLTHGKPEVNWRPYILAITVHILYVRKLISNRLSSNKGAKTTQ